MLTNSIYQASYEIPIVWKINWQPLFFFIIVYSVNKQININGQLSPPP